MTLAPRVESLNHGLTSKIESLNVKIVCKTGGSIEFLKRFVARLSFADVLRRGGVENLEGSTAQRRVYAGEAEMQYNRRRESHGNVLICFVAHLLPWRSLLDEARVGLEGSKVSLSCVMGGLRDD